MGYFLISEGFFLGSRETLLWLLIKRLSMWGMRLIPPIFNLSINWYVNNFLIPIPFWLMIIFFIFQYIIYIMEINKRKRTNNYRRRHANDTFATLLDINCEISKDMKKNESVRKIWLHGHDGILMSPKTLVRGRSGITMFYLNIIELF